MPVDSHNQKDSKEYQLHQYTNVVDSPQHNKYSRKDRALEDAVMEPAPVKITHMEEMKAWAKEKFGRMFGNKTMEKEGIAIEKAAHPNREWAKAEQRLHKIVSEQKKINYGRRYTLS